MTCAASKWQSEDVLIDSFMMKGLTSSLGLLEHQVEGCWMPHGLVPGFSRARGPPLHTLASGLGSPMTHSPG